ncbi:hypothetical protein ROZALSC1DRAFT_29304, partial [Rozella allomycis CSF55]
MKEKIRVLVLGDYDKFVGSAYWRKAAQDYGVPALCTEKDSNVLVVEWLEVGIDPTAKSTQTFVCVHDLSNRKSLQNMWKIIADGLSFHRRVSSASHEKLLHIVNTTEKEVLPILLVGTKQDKANFDILVNNHLEANLIEEYKAQSLHLTCKNGMIDESMRNEIYKFLFSIVKDTSSPTLVHKRRIFK